MWSSGPWGNTGANALGAKIAIVAPPMMMPSVVPLAVRQTQVRMSYSSTIAMMELAFQVPMMA